MVNLEWKHKKLWKSIYRYETTSLLLYVCLLFTGPMMQEVCVYICGPLYTTCEYRKVHARFGHSRHKTYCVKLLHSVFYSET